MFTPLIRLSLVGVVALSLLPLSATATDFSLPYRSSPGFVCYAWNTKGECTDFSYGSTSRSRTNNTRTYHDNSCKRYDRYGDCIPSSNSRYDDDVSIAVSARVSEVEQGDTVDFRLYVRNDNTVDRTTDVTAFLDPDMSFVSASNGGDDTRDEVYWNVRIPRNSSVTLNLRVRIDSSARDGDTLRLRAETDTDEDEAEVQVSDYYNSGSCLSYDRYGSCTRYSNNSSSRYCLSYDNYGRCTRYSSTTSSSRNCVSYDRYGSCTRYSTNTSSSRYCVSYDSYGYCTRYSNTSSSSRRCVTYDRYGSCTRYSTDNDDCNYSSSNNCSISLRAYASDDEADRGQLVTFTIVIKNDTNQLQRGPVRALLDPDFDFYSASDSGTNRVNDEVEWTDVLVNANSSRTLTLTARVDNNARRGDELFFEAEAAGDRDTLTVEVR